MQRIGVLGPKDSVERIVDVVKGMDEDIEVVPFIYKDVSETVGIVQKNFTKIKGWLFSGPTPYNTAVDSFGELENFDYCSFSDASLYKCFLQVAEKHNKVLNRLSIDISSYERHQGAFEELGIPLKDVHVHYYDINSMAEEMVKTHIELWNEGKIDAVITGLGKVYDIMSMKTDIPVYRNNVTAQAIRASMKRLIDKIITSYFKKTQVGFETLEVINYHELEEKLGSSYGMQKLELKLSERLLSFCEKLNGYLFNNGRGTYEIFSSRGEIESNISLLKDVIRQVEDILDVVLAVGIGFGDNVSYAQRNARRGLKQAKLKKQSRIVEVENTGLVIEDIGESEEIKYENYSYDQALLDKLKQANVGIKTYKKIDAIIQSSGLDTFTAAVLAEELSVTERNVRRIIASLNEVGLVEVIGNENVSGRGRPSKIYRMSILSK